MLYYLAVHLTMIIWKKYARAETKRYWVLELKDPIHGMSQEKLISCVTQDFLMTSDVELDILKFTVVRPHKRQSQKKFSHIDKASCFATTTS